MKHNKPTRDEKRASGTGAPSHTCAHCGRSIMGGKYSLKQHKALCASAWGN